ncbi:MULTISPECIES: asparaginase [unclassified Carboxydocella]|uniref:asparaginase n=1 Tax=unclassified Carboxydocella TaxID=2685367 RepID=UPI0009AEA1BA|nr:MULTISPECIES: asparaginase [unclassified Carboxydocella]GAW29984.1 asparaginase [Carboxydocella sp. ULO1]GAW30413.1 asparaginase [Carboxydocella sp. JDF658]
MNKVEILAQVLRNGLEESVHTGHIVVTDHNGTILAAVGNPDYKTFWRSAAKPIQALAVIEAGAVQTFDLEPAEIALLCASHNAEPEHIRVAQQLAAKIQADVTELHCGLHYPTHRPTAQEMRQRGEQPQPWHSNCSGKHLGMLALARCKGWDTQGYWLPEHPVQQEMLNMVSNYTDQAVTDIGLGVDGCGVPVFHLPLKSMAMAYARLVSSQRTYVADTVVRAMISSPYYVAGSDRICTDLMQVTRGRLLAKSGYEGVYCVGLVDQGQGLALKIADGNPRALGPILIEALQQLGWLTSTEKNKLASYWQVEVKNFHNAVVGTIKPVFKLAFHR